MPARQKNFIKNRSVDTSWCRNITLFLIFFSNLFGLGKQFSTLSIAQESKVLPQMQLTKYPQKTSTIYTLKDASKNENLKSILSDLSKSSTAALPEEKQKICSNFIPLIQEPLFSQTQKPDNKITAFYVNENALVFCGTPKGIFTIDKNSNVKTITGKDGLPYEDITFITGNKQGIIWLGTTYGAIRYMSHEPSAISYQIGTTYGAIRHSGESWEYFAGRRWLLDNDVKSIIANDDGGAWILTATGISKIEYKMMTLEEKAEIFEKRIRERHNRHSQVAGSNLLRPGDLTSNIPSSADNDGLWTAMYLGAECFRYAVTKSSEAKQYAKEAFGAIKRLEIITGIKGFPARSFAKADEDVGGGGEWHLTPDGKWKWKGDTSSDEIVGHFFAHALYYDLVADEEEKEEIRQLVSDMMNYIVDNGYYLLDIDKKPTTWGKWSPKHFKTAEGTFQKGLNSLEILSHLKVAYHITGNEKFQKEYLDLINKHDYAKNTIKQKLNMAGFVNHSDDELAFLSYYPLLLYEHTPEIRKIYMQSIERTWQIEKPEKNPLWNFIYGAALLNTLDISQSPDYQINKLSNDVDTLSQSPDYQITKLSNDFDIPSAVETLQKIPMDLIEWGMQNSQRTDLKLASTKGRFKELQTELPLPPDERPVMKWNGNPYRIDGGGDGREEDDGTFFLLPYWMGRYYNFISP